ncbi:MAG: hypothetical protein MZV64_16625 [Ignavibacteriales bacterium]|nr:hypothetical protein [Ignavibacteriales bacterium]
MCASQPCDRRSAGSCSACRGRTPPPPSWREPRSDGAPRRGPLQRTTRLLAWPAEPFTVVDTLTGARILVAAAYWKSAQPPVGSDPETELDPAQMYRVTATGLRDRARHPLSPANSTAVFAGSSHPDTLLPMVSIEGMRDSVRGIPVDASVIISFGEPVRRERIAGGSRSSIPSVVPSTTLASGKGRPGSGLLQPNRSVRLRGTGARSSSIL